MKQKNAIADLVKTVHPEFNAETVISATNRIDEYLSDLATQYENAVRFIEDPHEGKNGVLLEWLTDDGKWRPSEINDGGILSDNVDCESIFDDEVHVGLYANWGKNCWGDCAGDDWNSRLGVWKEAPKKIGEEVIGDSEERIRHESYGDYKDGANIGRYRLRIVPLGPFSDEAKKWLYEHIDKINVVQEARLAGI